jgi:hypothetical protein
MSAEIIEHRGDTLIVRISGLFPSKGIRRIPKARAWLARST